MAKEALRSRSRTTESCTDYMRGWQKQALFRIEEKQAAACQHHWVEQRDFYVVIEQLRPLLSTRSVTRISTSDCVY